MITLDTFLSKVSAFARSKKVPISKYLNHIYSHEGLHGLCVRLKVIYSWYLQILSGNLSYKKDGWGVDRVKGINFPYIRYAHHLNECFASAIKRDDIDYICAVLDVIRCYKFVQGPVKADYVKMLKEDIFFAKPKPPNNSQDLINGLKDMVKELVKVRFTWDPGKDLRWVYTPSSVLLDTNGKLTLSGTIQDFALLHSDKIKDNFYLVNRVGQLEGGSYAPTGKLAIVGEGGLKTRIVAVMSLVDSSICRPIHDFLQDILRCIPQDCMSDQEKGRIYLDNMTRAHRFIGSIDLKQASWHIPTEWLVAVGRELQIPNGILRYFSDCTFNYDTGCGEFSKGKPTCAAMGLPGTFPLFSLTLHCLIRHILKTKFIPDPDCYRLLGDDIIVTSKRLYHELIRTFHNWSIPISAHKTFYSHCLGEFAGSVSFKGNDISSINWTVLDSGSVNSAYRGKPLLLRYANRMGRHVVNLLKPTSDGSKLVKRMSKSNAQEKKVLLSRMKAGGIENIDYCFYRDMLRLFALLPSNLGGFLGQPIRSRFVAHIVSRKESMLNLACRYLLRHITKDEPETVNVYTYMPGHLGYKYQVYLNLVHELVKDVKWVLTMMKAAQKKITGKVKLNSKEKSFYRLFQYLKSISDLGIDSIDKRLTNKGVELAVPIGSTPINGAMSSIPFKDFDSVTQGLVVPVVPLLRDSYYKPVTGFALPLLNKSRSGVIPKEYSKPKLWSLFKRLLKRASVKRQIEESFAYSLGQRSRFRWDRIYCTVRPELR